MFSHKPRRPHGRSDVTVVVEITESADPDVLLEVEE